MVRQTQDHAERVGRKGITMEGSTFPESSGLSEFMPRDYFLSLGFGQLDQHRNSRLLFMPISPDASPPRYSESEFSPPPGKERLKIDILNCDKCVGSMVNSETVGSIPVF